MQSGKGQGMGECERDEHVGVLLSCIIPWTGVLSQGFWGFGVLE